MVENIFIKNKKGLKVAAVIEKPKDGDIFPTIILLHGFKGYKEEETYTLLAKKLKDEGIASIRFDASGFGESEGTLEKDYRLSNYVDDAQVVYEYLLKQEWVDKVRIGIYGQSMGGLQAIILASNNENIKAVVSVSPPDLFATRDHFGNKLQEWKEEGYLEMDSSLVGKIKIPYDYAEDARKYDGRKIVKKVNSPILFVLGLDDKTVHPDQTRDVYKAANEPKKIIEVEGMDHFYKRDKRIMEKVNNLVLDFLKSKL